MTTNILNFCVAFIFTALAASGSLIGQDGDKQSGSQGSPTASQAGVAVAAQAKLSDSPPTVAEIDAKTAEVVAAADLGEAVIAASKETLQQTKQAVAAADGFVTQATAFQKDATAAPGNLVSVRKQLENKQADDKPNTNQTLAELKLVYESTEADLKAARQLLTSQSGEASRRQSRLAEIPSRITEAEQELDKLNAQMEKLVDDVDPALVVDVRRMSLQAQRFKLRSEISALESERKFYTAAIELLPLQNELLQRKIERLQNHSAQLKTAVEQKRETEIDKLRRLVKEQESKTPESIMSEATINVGLVDQYIANSKRLAVVGSTAETTRKALEEVESEYKKSIERVDAVGLNETLGLMFRRSKSTLAARRRSFQPDGTLQTEIRKLQIEMFGLDDLSKNVSETEATINNVLESNKVDLDQLEPKQRELVKESVVQLLSQRREILGQLMTTKTELYNRLGTLDVDKRKTVQEIDAYTNYINEHVLWIRSGAMVGRDDVHAFARALQWVTLPSNWIELGQTLVSGIQKNLDCRCYFAPQSYCCFWGSGGYAGASKRRGLKRKRVVAEPLCQPQSAL